MTTSQEDVELARAAGLFEGEGCITMNGSTFALRLNNTDESVVLRFHEVLQIGWVYGPYRQDNARDGHRRKPFWAWVAQREDALEAMNLMAPWLSERRLMRAQELTGIRFPVKWSDSDAAV